MPGLVPGIHVLCPCCTKNSWMAGASPAMTKTVNEISDEQLACQLLTEHLTEQTTQKFVCEVNSDDPPDILVTWCDGSLWGFEVTRVYQQVLSSDGESVISSAGLSEPLYRFAQQLKQKTESIRERDFVLALGPGTLKDRLIVFDKAWQRRSEKAIVKHIQGGRTDILRCSGVKLKPGAPGNLWRVIVNHPVAEINSATLAMLERALEAKTKGLPRWNRHLSQRWLLLLNDFILVDEICMIERAVKQLIRSKPNLRGFDGVLWKGATEQALEQVWLA